MGDVINLNKYRKQCKRDEKAGKVRESLSKSGHNWSGKAAQRHEAKKTSSELEHKCLIPEVVDVSDTDPSVKPDTKHEPPEDITPSSG